MEIPKKLQSYLLLLVVITLPWSIQLPNTGIIIAFVLWLLIVLYEREIKTSAVAVLSAFLIYFLLLTISYFYSSSKVDALKMLETRSAFIALPLILMSGNRIDQKYFYLIKVLFIISVSVITLLTFREGFGFMNSPSTHIAIQNLIPMHRPYLGAYCSIAILFLVEMFNTKKNPRWLNVLVSLTVLYLIAFLCVVISKNALVGLALALFFLLAVKLKKLGWNYVILLFTLTIIGLGLLVASNTHLKELLRNTIKFRYFSSSEYSDDITDSFNRRFDMWNCSFKVLNEHQKWISGFGLGAEQNYLDSCYVGRGQPYMAQVHFNAHNQILQDFLAGGVLLGCASILLFLIPAFEAISKRDPIFLCFLIVIFVFSITESVFLRQKGVVLYALFTGFFASVKKSE